MTDFNPKEALAHIFATIPGFADRKLSQNFLIDKNTYFEIAKLVDPQKTDHIFEIGSGPALLTELFLQKCPDVTACEVDQRFFPRIKAIGAKLDSKSATADRDWSPYNKIVGNIPYHLTGQIFRTLCTRSKPKTITLIVQLEVAQRVCEQGSLLHLLVAIFGTPKIAKIIPATAFDPAPKVDSAILHIIAHSQPFEIENIEKFLRWVSIPFANKRKMLRKSIPADILAAMKVENTLRPENVTLAQWITGWNTHQKTLA